MDRVPGAFLLGVIFGVWALFGANGGSLTFNTGGKSYANAEDHCTYCIHALEAFKNPGQSGSWISNSQLSQHGGKDGDEQ
jgi:hypothetical protein